MRGVVGGVRWGSGLGRGLGGAAWVVGEGGEEASDEEIGVKRPLEAPSEAAARGGFRCLAELMSLLEEVFSGSERGGGGGEGQGRGRGALRPN